MIGVSRYETVSITTTPRQLRIWADKMEKEMPQKTIGDDVTIIDIFKGDTRLKIMADQDAYHARDTYQRWV